MWPSKKEISAKPEDDIQFIEGKSCNACHYSIPLFTYYSNNLHIRVCIKCGNDMKESVMKKCREYILYKNEWVLYSYRDIEQKLYYVFDHWL